MHAGVWHAATGDTHPRSQGPDTRPKLVSPEALTGRQRLPFGRHAVMPVVLGL